MIKAAPLYKAKSKPLISSDRGGRRIFPKLEINTPGDRYEQEADAMAERVMKTPPAHQSAGIATGMIGRVMRKEANGSGLQASPGLVSRLENSGAGTPLRGATRDIMENAFSSDFSKVRIHTDTGASQMNRDINARAFTHGHDIFFRQGNYKPETAEGKKLLAHELTHTIQQGEKSGHSAAQMTIQRDYALDEPNPDRVAPALTRARLEAAKTYNARKFTNVAEIRLIRDVIGISPDPAVVDDDFVHGIAQFQANFGLEPDGLAGRTTVNMLTREMLRESSSLVADGRPLGNLGLIFELKTDLNALVTAGNSTYADYKTKIQAATPIQKEVVLLDEAFLREIRAILPWSSFARCIELLGRQAPGFSELSTNATVRAAIRAAWNASNPAVPVAGVTHQHEEGGWVYMDLFTGELTTRRQAAGAGAAINLAAPPIITGNVVVSKFHTHPNLGPGWVAQPSPQDNTVDPAHGVPDLVAGTTGVDPAVFTIFAGGPNSRLHLAGNQGLPGAAGGLAPQGKADQTHDEQ